MKRRSGGRHWVVSFFLEVSASRRCVQRWEPPHRAASVLQCQTDQSERTVNHEEQLPLQRKRCRKSAGKALDDRAGRAGDVAEPTPPATSATNPPLSSWASCHCLIVPLFEQNHTTKQMAEKTNPLRLALAEKLHCQLLPAYSSITDPRAGGTQGPSGPTFLGRSWPSPCPTESYQCPALGTPPSPRGD